MLRRSTLSPVDSSRRRVRVGCAGGCRGDVDPRVISIVSALLLFAATQLATAQAGRYRFPERLESYMANAVKLTSDERQRLSAGTPVTKMLDADESKEVAVFGAVWISAPIARYVEAVKNIEAFERGGGFKVARCCPVSQVQSRLNVTVVDSFASRSRWNRPGVSSPSN